MVSKASSSKREASNNFRIVPISHKDSYVLFYSSDEEILLQGHGSRASTSSRLLTVCLLKMSSDELGTVRRVFVPAYPTPP